MLYNLRYFLAVNGAPLTAPTYASNASCNQAAPAETEFMRVLWPHNFNPAVAGSGRFMHDFAEGFSSLGVKVELRYLEGLGSPSGLLRARAAVREYSSRFDLVHAQFGSACAFASSSAKSPKIVSLRGSDWHRYRGNDIGEYVHGIMAFSLTGVSLRSYDAVIVMSNRAANEVRAAYSTLPVAVIPDPINLGAFYPRDRCTARSSFFADNSKAPWLLFTTLSRNNPVKRTDLAVKVSKLVQQRIPEIKLMVASGVPHEQMPLFVSSCNVVICTSTHEGWPNSVKEALACNVPFVSTDVSDLRDIARRRQTCKVGNAIAEELASLVIEVLSMPQDQTLSAEVSDMGIEKSCAKLMKLYENVLNRTPSGS